MKTETPVEIALVQSISKLFPDTNYNNIPKDISVSIATLEGPHNTPRNFSLDYETPKSSNGGCHARIFASDIGEGVQGNLFSCYGPDINYGQARDYEHALRADQRIRKRMTALQELRGNPVDAADLMGRWLEATGVTKVYVRPEGGKDNGWLNKGEWRILTIGAFVNQVRSCLYVKPATVETAVNS